MEIKHENNSIKLYQADQVIGEISYQYYDENTLDVYKTFVNPEYRGQGLAQVLLKELMKFVTEKELLVIPNCSYVYTAFLNNPQYKKYQHPTVAALPSCRL